MPSDVDFCDHIEHQMFPITTWGDEFVAAHSEADYYRFIASEDGTVIPTSHNVPARRKRSAPSGTSRGA